VEPRSAGRVWQGSRNVGDIGAGRAELAQQFRHAELRVLRLIGEARPGLVVEE
jgi:hypothetical protein